MATQQFDTGERVFVTEQTIVEHEPATIKAYDPGDDTYWCVLDNGPQKELPTFVGKTWDEKRLSPAWYPPEYISRE